MGTHLRKSHYVYILLILISGFFLSARGYSKINTYEIQQNDARLSEEAAYVVKGFQDFLLNKYNTLRYMKAYFYAYDFLDLEAFELFSTSILLFEPSIESLLFVLEILPEKQQNYAAFYQAIYGVSLPFATSSENNKIYPVHFLKTFNQKALLAGTNVADFPNVHAAIHSVAQTAEPELVFVDQIRGVNKDVYIIDPLFSVGKEPA